MKKVRQELREVKGLQMTGHIDLQAFSIITSTTNGYIRLAANGSGPIILETTTGALQRTSLGGLRGASATDLQLYNGTIAAGANSTISGGYSNATSAADAVIAGGIFNTASGTRSVVGGGFSNLSSLDYATIAGGTGNIASGFAAFIGSGTGSTASGSYSVIGGGASNTASAQASAILGGFYNVAEHSGAICLGSGGRSVANYDIVAARTESAGAIANNYFRLVGAVADMHLGHQVDQAAISGASNQLLLHTINASNQSKYIGLVAPSALTVTQLYTLPLVVDAGKFLKTDASGITSWDTPTAVAPVVVSAGPYAATNGQYVFADTSGGAFTITLPGAPAVGTTIRIGDAKGTWLTNNITLDPGALKIRGVVATFPLNVSFMAVDVVYIDAAYGWQVLT
jgi:hypothetical protein